MSVSLTVYSIHSLVQADNGLEARASAAAAKCVCFTATVYKPSPGMSCPAICDCIVLTSTTVPPSNTHCKVTPTKTVHTSCHTSCCQTATRTVTGCSTSIVTDPPPPSSCKPLPGCITPDCVVLTTATVHPPTCGCNPRPTSTVVAPCPTKCPVGCRVATTTVTATA